MSILEEIIERTVEDVERRREKLPPKQLEAMLSDREEPMPFAEALTGDGIAIIAEHKRASPSAGAIRAGSSVEEVVGAYERGGASALSVLTEEHWFKGSLDDLRAARAVSRLPIIRKDFIVDPYQVYEAAVAGADAILLIVAALHPEDLAILVREARGLDLDVLVEIHDEEELETALEYGDAELIGINNRDLRDFSVDLERTYELLTDVPAGKIVVSESGISTNEQLLELERRGVDAVLVGETLMRAPDIESACHALRGATTEHRRL
ncbi:MAG: indole-3-glycerol phosphate synthase [Solirubrobacteraceae bacterium]|nr:indole-3-glycerol phosphate synthase [Solirubrobacteraceae bacterium]